MEGMKSLIDNKGNVKNTVKEFMKDCGGEMDKAAKKQGYPKIEGSPISNCVLKYRKIEDWDNTALFLLNGLTSIIQDVDTFALMIPAMMKEDLLKPLFASLSTLLGAASA
jgi:hypothetical protein